MSRKTQAEKLEESCPNRGTHTPAPKRYLNWHAWAEEMHKTHEQRKCPGCGMRAIWVPRSES